ncbi:hypothetical protein [Parashewanella curva]|nr:hypothetical protein [Parashewanella curva]
MDTLNIVEISLARELFYEIEKWCKNRDLMTTHYNHGWKPLSPNENILVNRDYTLNFCLQQTKIDNFNQGTGKTYYKIVRSGRPVTKYGRNNEEKNIKRLKDNTPSFDQMVYPIINEYQHQIRKIKRR